MSPLSLIHSKRPSAVDNVLESYTMFCVDFMGLPGFHTSASIPLHNFFKWLTQLLQTTRLITSFRKAGGRPDREPAAIKTSGTGPHSHRTFYCCTIMVGTGIGPKMFCSVLFCYLLLPCLWFPALSTGRRWDSLCVLTTLCLYLRKRTRQKKQRRLSLNKHNP